MATRVNIPSTLNASMGIDDFILAITAMGQNVTAESALVAVNDLPGGDAGDKIAALCVYSACSVKKVCDSIVTACNLSVPDTWKVDQTVNFSMFAMIGHLMMMLPDTDLTPRACSLRPMYTKSIGGAANLAVFGSDGVIPGKAPRTAILREWSGRVSGVDTYKIRKALGAKFPKMVKPVASFPGAGLFYKLLNSVISSITFFPRLLMEYKLTVLLVLVLIPASRPRVLSAMELVVKMTARVPAALARTKTVSPYAESAMEGIEMMVAGVPDGLKETVSEAFGFGVGAYHGFKEGNLIEVLYDADFSSLQQIPDTVKEWFEAVIDFFSEEGEALDRDEGDGGEETLAGWPGGDMEEQLEEMDYDEF